MGKVSHILFKWISCREVYIRPFACMCMYIYVYMYKRTQESGKAGLKLNIQQTKIMASGPITSWQIDGGKKWKQWQILFSWAPKSQWTVTVAMEFKDSLDENYEKSRHHIKKQRHHFADKGPYSQRYGFSSSHVMWELDHKEGWAPKNWCFQTVGWRRL